MGIGLLHAFNVAAYRHAGPQLAKGFRRLVHQFLGMGQKQHSAAAGLCIHYGGDSLARPGGMVQQGDGLTVIPHGLQGFQSFQLMLFQLQLRAVQGFSSLLWKIIFDFTELRMTAQEYL